jgi:hypothetical protein
MSVMDWWSALDWETQDWISRHLGEVLPHDIAAQVAAAGGDLRRTHFLSPVQEAYRLRQRDTRQILHIAARAA